MKITSGQRIALVGIEEKDLEGVFADLEHDADRTSGPCLHYVQACPGTEICRFGNQDSLSLALRIETAVAGKVLPAKLKDWVSGCPRCCGESHTRDIRVMGTNRGWTVIFGGNSGTRPRIGNVVARDLSGGEALDLVTRLVEYFQRHARQKERTARFMERTGTDTLKSELLVFIPYIPVREADRP